MDVERMHDMIEKLSEVAKCEIDKGIENVDTCEMGQVVDMLKDLSEAMYYRKVTHVMEEFGDNENMEMFDRYGDGRRFYDNYRYANGRFAPKGHGSRRGYEERPYYHMTPEMYRNMDPEYMRDMDYDIGRMYFSDKRNPGMTGAEMSGNKHYYGGDVQMDSKAGKAGMSRKTYMESKDLHDLEAYMKDTAEDLTEVYNSATNEAKTMLKAKIQTLLQKM